MAARALVILILAALPFAGALQADFVWDDDLLIVQRAEYRTPDLFPESWTSGLIFSPNYYRPIALLSLFADSRVHGLDPRGFHLTNLVLHALVSLLVYVVLARLFRGSPEWLPFWLALLFAVHPVHVETVAFVSSRFDLVCALFSLLALHLGLCSAGATTSPGRVGLATASGAAFLMALGSKEMAFALPLAGAAWIGWQRTGRSAQVRPTSGRLVRLVPLAVTWSAAAGLYLVLRLQGLGHVYRAGTGVDVGSPYEHLLLVSRTVTRLAGLLVFPWGRLSPLHVTAVPVPPDDGGARLALVFVVAALAVLGWFAYRRQPWTLLCGAFLVSLLPVANIAPIALGGGSFVAERFAYLPSVFGLAAVAPGALWLVGRASQVWHRRAVAGLAAGLALAFATASALAVPHWRDERALWTWAATRSPQSDLPWINLGVQAHREGDGDRALEYATRAITANPGNINAYDLAGAAHLLRDEPSQAERIFRAGLARAPDYANLWANLAHAVRRQGRIEEAMRILTDEAIPRAPSFWTGHLELGRALLDAGRPDDAISAFEMAWRLVPGSRQVARGLAAAHRDLGRDAGARAWDARAEEASRP